MRLHYYPETDSLYIEILTNASQVIDLSRLEAEVTHY